MPERYVNPLLSAALKPLKKYYDKPGLEEIAINREGEIWLKYSGLNAGEDTSLSGWKAIKAPEITYTYVEDICVQLANVSRQHFDPDRDPILYADLPEGHRFTAILGRNVQYDNFDDKGVAMSVRLFAPDKEIEFSKFGLQSGQPLAPKGKGHNGRNRYSDDPLQDLIEAVQHGEAVLISGATSTGKTTFLNKLLRSIPLDRRIITLEDVRELKVAHENRVHLLTSRTQSASNVDDKSLLDIVVRMTPDVLVCGEIGIKNAPGIYRLMTTGHANFMCTIHAESPELAIRAFYQNLSQAMPGMDAETVMEIIATSFGRIVQIEREGRNRVVTAIDMPKMATSTLMEQTTTP